MYCCVHRSPNAEQTVGMALSPSPLHSSTLMSGDSHSKGSQSSGPSTVSLHSHSSLRRPHMSTRSLHFLVFTLNAYRRRSTRRDVDGGLPAAQPPLQSLRDSSCTVRLLGAKRGIQLPNVVASCETEVCAFLNRFNPLLFTGGPPLIVHRFNLDASAPETYRS